MSYEDWKEYKLGDFAEVQNGYAFKSNEFAKSGIPVIKIKNITSSRISLEDAQYYNAEISGRLKSFLINKNDILISMTGSHINQIASAVGKVGKYQHDFPALLNQRVGKVYIKNSLIGDHNFLYYFLNRFETQFKLATSAGGSANQANISPDQIKNLLINLPPLRVQRRIAAILSSLDEKIELNHQTNQTLEAISQAIFKEWFIDFNFPDNTGKMKDSELGKIPNRWKVGKLQDEGTFKNGINYSREENGDTEYSIINVRNVVENKFISKSLLDTIKINKKKAIPYLLQADDIVIVRSASPGESAIILMHEENLIYSGFTIRYRLTNKNYFLYYFFIFQSVRKVFDNLSNGTTLKNINQEMLKEFTVIIPEESLVLKFNKIIESLFNKVLTINQELRILTELRDTLLPKLMKGEIPIPEVEKQISAII